MPPLELGVAVVGSGPTGRFLREGLTAHGLRIVAEIDPTDDAAVTDKLASARALIVDMAALSDSGHEGLGEMLAVWSGPVVFADDGIGDSRTVSRLAMKLHSAATTVSPVPTRAVESAAADFPVCVLAASFGGPPALRRFLHAFRRPPEAAFVIAQHIGEGFAGVLARELDRGGVVSVRGAVAGVALSPRRAWVHPVGERLALDIGDRFRRAGNWPDNAFYRPCIDDIATDVAGHYRARAAMVVFTGMGGDGVAGARAIAEAGGRIWVQSSASAAVANMPEAVAASGVDVHGRGEPEALAKSFELWLRGRGRPQSQVAMSG